MWEIDYTEEVKFYFIDNGKLVFELLVKIEELKFTEDGIPSEGCTQLEPHIYLWEVLGHSIIYRKTPTTRKLIIAVVKPQE